MRAFLRIFLFVTIITFSAQAQVIITEPSFVTEGVQVTVTFDASLGNQGLRGYTGDVYAHTGVITSKSASSSDWKYGSSSAWGVNESKYKMTSLGNNKWKLVIGPNIRSFYGITDNSEVIKQLAFVFRSGSKVGTSYLEGKDTNGKDILANVYNTGLNVKFTSPTSFRLVSKGANITFTAVSSQSTALKLYINSTQFFTATGTSISKDYTFNTEGSFWAIAEAGTGTSAVRDSVYVNVRKDVETASRPSLPDGINIVNNNTVTFILYAPSKSYVFLVGDFNKWLPRNEHMMKKDGDYWWLTLNGLQPNVEYAFQYYVNGASYVGDAYSQKVLDPWNDKYISSTTYPNLKPYPSGKDTNDGMVSVFQTNETPYSWEVAKFKGPRQDKLVIYELLLRDFTTTGELGTGDLNGAMTKLDYLKNLGVNAIQLMPTQEFDGNSNWGYSPCFYFAMDKAYGTKAMYKKFIDECHKRGMAVILDVVYNHATGQHPFAKLYWNASADKPASNNPWFNVDATHPYSVYNDFNHSSTLVKTYFKRNLKFLLEEYKFDGFRFDLTKGFTQNKTTESTASNYDASRIAILKEYYNQIKATNTDAYMIIEHFCADSEERELATAGMMPWGNKNNAYCQSAMGYQSDSDFNGINGWTRSWSINNLVGYMESHDEERTIYKAKTYGDGNIKTSLAVQMDRAALNAAFFLPIPGPKMIWQFGELGYDVALGSGLAKLDPKPVYWNYYENTDRRRVYDTYSRLNKLREQYGNAFDNSSNWSMQIGGGDWEQGRRICLNSSDLKMVIVGNFNSSGTVTTNPNFPTTGTWYDLMTEEAMNVTSTNMTIPLAAGKFKVLTNKKINLSSGIDEIKKKELSLQQTHDYLTIVTEEPVVTAKIYNINGILIKQTQNEKSFSITNLPQGCYILNVQLSGENISCKFVK